MKLSFLSLCFSALILASCTKEEVSASGSNQNGYDYSAPVNILSSDWVSASLNWSNAPAASDSALQAYWSAGVNQEVINNGVVLIYAKDQSSGTVKSFPARFDINDNEFDSYSSVVEPYSIQLVHSSYRNGQYITPVKNDNVSFRYILIENAAYGSIQTGSGGEVSVENLKYMSYDDVVSLLSIDK